jgi:hypothetical protein
MGAMNERVVSDAGIGGVPGAAGRPSFPAAEASTRRPLYLGGETRAVVDLDGPALLVHARGRAEARYPLARVSRVVAHFRTEWRARAVMACFERGIPIVVTGADEAPLGYMLPAVQAPSRLDRNIQEVLDRPDWREHYGDWLRAERMRLLAEWQGRREAAGSPVPEGTVRELRRRHVYLGERPEVIAEGGLLKAAIRALAAESLRKAGLRAVYWGFGGEALPLLQDLSELLELSLCLELRGLGESAHFDTPSFLRVFHAFASSLAGVCSAVLGRLHRRVRALLEEWR